MSLMTEGCSRPRWAWMILPKCKPSVGGWKDEDSIVSVSYTDLNLLSPIDTVMGSYIKWKTAWFCCCFFVLFRFGFLAAQHAGSYFPDQGSNLHPLQ